MFNSFVPAGERVCHPMFMPKDDDKSTDFRLNLHTGNYAWRQSSPDNY